MRRVIGMTNKLKEQSGFTLIEVIVAIVIITALVATFAPLIMSSIENIQWAGKRTQELYTIRGTMEKKVAIGTDGTDYTFTISGPEFIGIAKGLLVKEDDGQLVTFLAPKKW